MSQTFLEYYKNFFEGKKITKQGFGILGRGGGVTKFLIEMGADILVTDMKTEENFKDQIIEVNNFLKEINKIKKENGEVESKIKYVFGGHKMEDFLNCDFVIQASGVPKDNIFLKAARDAGKIVYQEGSLFCEIVKNYFDGSPENLNEERDKVNIIGVTGTRGKTTTTFLIKHILEKNFENTNKKVYFGGNVQGVATLELLKKIKAGDFVVMELDSWVLQGFKDINFSPHISVFTNLMNDHMNYYHDDMKEYFLDKANIFLYQKEGDKLILSENSFEACRKYLVPSDFQKQFFIPQNYFENLSPQTGKRNAMLITKEIINEDKNIFESNLLGEHNRINISLAVAAAKECDVSEEKIKEAIKSFKGVPGRLEMRREIKKEIDNKKVIIKYYNDTTATTEEATIAALNALTSHRPSQGVGQAENINSKIILICGGRDKELTCNNLAEKIKELKNKNILEKVILLSDRETTNGTEKLILEFKKIGFEEYFVAKNLNEAQNEITRFLTDFLQNAKAENLKKSTSFSKEVNALQNNFVILFSPAFASFGLFKNEYDRGEKFNEIVDNL